MCARTVSSPPESKTPGLSSELTLLFCSEPRLPADKEPGKAWPFRVYPSSDKEQRLAAGEALGDWEGHRDVLIRTGREMKQSQSFILSKFNPGEIFPLWPGNGWVTSWGWARRGQE